MLLIIVGCFIYTIILDVARFWLQPTILTDRFMVFEWKSIRFVKSIIRLLNFSNL